MVTSILYPCSNIRGPRPKQSDLKRKVSTVFQLISLHGIDWQCLTLLRWQTLRLILSYSREILKQIVTSRYIDWNAINALLFNAPNGAFVRNAEEILSQYFETSVCVEAISPANTSSDVSWIQVIIILSISFCILIIAVIYWHKYRQKKRKLSYTTYRRNHFISILFHNFYLYLIKIHNFFCIS